MYYKLNGGRHGNAGNAGTNRDATEWQKGWLEGRRRSRREASDMEQEVRGTKKTCSTKPSRVVPHRSTTLARPSLTSLFRWEAVTLGDMAA
jgi:hypothetical protein